eukprot:PhF_6_TR44446/c0_g1_i1/m.68418
MSREIHVQHFLDGFRSLFESGILSDVTITAQDTAKTFRVHRAILCAQSPTFHSMFSSNMQECTMDVIQVPFRETCMEAVLWYIYFCDIGKVTQVNAMEVLDAAHYYQIKGLCELCIEFLRSNTTNDNVCNTLECALKYNLPSLREHCVAFVRQYNTDVIHNPHRLERVSGDVLLLLLQEAVIDSDMNILRQCHAWAVSHSEHHGPNSDVFAQLLQPFLRLIDFTAMTAEEIEEVEKNELVPIKYLYEVFKKRVLGAPSDLTPRRGGIPLQWDSAHTRLRLVDSAVSWESSRNTSFDGTLESVVTLNKFSRGVHYWTFTVSDINQAGDVCLGVTRNGGGGSVQIHQGNETLALDPFTAGLVPAGSISGETHGYSDFLLRHDGSGEVGVRIDFDTTLVEFFDHTTKAKIVSTRWSGLVGPTYLFVAMLPRCQGTVVLSDTTSYLLEPSKLWNANDSRRNSNSSSARRTPTKHSRWGSQGKK